MHRLAKVTNVKEKAEATRYGEKKKLKMDYQ